MAPGKNGTALPDLTDIFKTHPQPAVLTEMLVKYRNLAKTHLQDTIPNKILVIQNLLATESDPSSALWVGHVDTPTYSRPTLLQPTDVDAQSHIGEEYKVVLPSEVVRAKEADHGDTDDQSLSEGEKNEMPNGVNGLPNEAGQRDGQLVKGVRTGQHWFEVVPQNKVQDELVKLSVKEHEDLHMITQDLRIWLELEIPLIEDGNSFGADVQAHLIRELMDVYKKSNSYQNGCRSHYTDRLRLAQEWVKYPNLRDYPAAIAASDRFDHFLLRSYLRSLLICYGGLLTKFEKNWSKVINPKPSSSSGGGMY